MKREKIWEVCKNCDYIGALIVVAEEMARAIKRNLRKYGGKQNRSH